MTTDCIFCKILSGIVESEILYQNDSCFVIRDIVPNAPLHLLIIPNKHITYFDGMTKENFEIMGDLFLAARKMAKSERVNNNGYRLIINQGNNAGQQIPHLHIHLLAGKILDKMG